jgi:hypothetical protein
MFVDGDVGRFEGVPARAEGVQSPAVVKENGGLTFSDGQLGAEFDFTRAFPGNPVNQLLPRFVKPFDDFQKNNIVCSHDSHPSCAVGADYESFA